MFKEVVKRAKEMGFDEKGKWVVNEENTIAILYPDYTSPILERLEKEGLTCEFPEKVSKLKKKDLESLEYIVVAGNPILTKRFVDVVRLFFGKYQAKAIPEITVRAIPTTDPRQTHPVMFEVEDTKILVAPAIVDVENLDKLPLYFDVCGGKFTFGKENMEDAAESVVGQWLSYIKPKYYYPCPYDVSNPVILEDVMSQVPKEELVKKLKVKLLFWVKEHPSKYFKPAEWIEYVRKREEISRKYAEKLCDLFLEQNIEEAKKVWEEAINRLNAIKPPREEELDRLSEMEKLLEKYGLLDEAKLTYRAAVKESGAKKEEYKTDLKEYTYARILKTKVPRELISWLPRPSALLHYRDREFVDKLVELLEKGKFEILEYVHDTVLRHTKSEDSAIGAVVGFVKWARMFPATREIGFDDVRTYLREMWKIEVASPEEKPHEKPKRTPTLEDILAELEPLGYRERWRVVESLKAKGFEDVEETIDKFIRESKLRRVGKYIEATREVWREYMDKVAEEKPPEIVFEVIDWTVDADYNKGKWELVLGAERKEAKVGEVIRKTFEFVFNNLEELNDFLRRGETVVEDLDLGKVKIVWEPFELKPKVPLGYKVDNIVVDRIIFTPKETKYRIYNLSTNKALWVSEEELDETLKAIKERIEKLEEQPRERALQELEDIVKQYRAKAKEIMDFFKKYEDILKENEHYYYAVKNIAEWFENKAKDTESWIGIRGKYADIDTLKKQIEYLKESFREWSNTWEQTKREVEEWIKKQIERKPPEKPPAKPPEPYDFVLEKLKSTFLAELELAGLKREEAERELEAIMFEIEKFARDIVEGKLSQVDAVKEVIKKARTITRPTEVAPPEEVKVEVVERPRRIRRAEEIWKEREVEYAPPPEVAPPTETTEMAMSIKDVMESLGWKGVVELLKPHLPEIFAYGIENFLKRHREWSLAIPPVKRNIEAIFRNLRRLIEQQALEKYERGELSVREWLIGGAPETIRYPLLAELLYYGYASEGFKKELKEVYERPNIQKLLRKYGITNFDEFYNAMVEFLRQYRL